MKGAFLNRNHRAGSKPTNQPSYKNSGIAAERRVRDQWNWMTVAESAAKMLCVWQEKGPKLVQLCLRDLVSSVTRPIKELKGFKKVSLQPGETKTVALEITPESLAFYDLHMKWVVEPGDFEILVGNSSRDGDLQKVILTVTP